MVFISVDLFWEVARARVTGFNYENSSSISLLYSKNDFAGVTISLQDLMSRSDVISKGV